MTPAGTSNELDVQNEWEENTHTLSLIPPWEDQREWHRMTRMTRPDCAVMCNLINTHTHSVTVGFSSILYCSVDPVCSSCVTPAGTSNELDVQNEWEENKMRVA